MAADFPLLSGFLRAYLHQDFAAVHGSAREAVSACRRAATAEEWDALCAEWHRFLHAHRPDTFAQARNFLCENLGCSWYPRRWGDLARLLPKPGKNAGP